MGTLTIRTQPEHEAELDTVSATLGEKTRSQTMLKCLMRYQAQCDEIERLYKALRKAEAERNDYKSRLDRFRDAQRALFE